MDSKPLISIIIPVFNTLPYLRKCVESILNQTYCNIEVILVDDGSTDACGDLCDKLAGEDTRIRVIHKKNGGSSSARNLGLLSAGGEYIGFVDSDDFVEPDMYERLLAGIKKYGVSCAQIGRNEIDEEGNLLPDLCPPPAEEMLISHRDFLKELLMHRGDCSFCTKLIAREIFNIPADSKAQSSNRIETVSEANTAYEFFPLGVLNEDFHILVQKLPQMGNVLSLPGYGYHVFYRIGSNSRKENKNQFSTVFGDSVDNADMALGLVKEHYPDDAELLKTAFRFNVFQRIEYLLHIPIPMMTKPEKAADEYGKRVAKQYGEVVSWMRKNYWKSMGNGVLTKKNKVYHTLFAIAPKAVRKIHKKLKHID